MKCGYCGLEFEETEGKKGCGNCRGGCFSIHCPSCNYKNPIEPAFIKNLKSLFDKNKDKKGGAV